jgi:hypothetical protein
MKCFYMLVFDQRRKTLARAKYADALEAHLLSLALGVAIFVPT